MAILPEGAAEKLDLTTEADGTGPFKLESSDASSTVLTAFDDYWGGKPSIDGVEFRYITEPAAALTALKNGEVQWTDNVPPQQVEVAGRRQGRRTGQHRQRRLLVHVDELRAAALRQQAGPPGDRHRRRPREGHEGGRSRRRGPTRRRSPRTASSTTTTPRSSRTRTRPSSCCSRRASRRRSTWA
jgi:MarR-like DNA-binding transcriptional regulator SgrR of sgrS sRNA